MLGCFNTNLGKIWTNPNVEHRKCDQVFEGWAANSLASDTAATNQLFPVENNVIASG